MEALLAVEQVRCAVPCVAHGIDIEGVLLIYIECALCDGLTDNGKAYASLFEDGFYASGIGLGHLYHYTGVLGEEYLHDVLLLESAEVDVHTALRIGEAHLKQCGHHTTGRDVVAGHEQALIHELLHGDEGVAEVFGIHSRHFATYLIQGLEEGRATECQCVVAEVDMIEQCILVVHYNGRYHLLHVRYLATGRHDNRTGTYHLGAVGVLLRHGKRILTGRHVDVEVAAEVRECLYGLVQAGILTLL